jgi:hypothetical protein
MIFCPAATRRPETHDPPPPHPAHPLLPGSLAALRADHGWSGPPILGRQGSVRRFRCRMARIQAASFGDAPAPELPLLSLPSALIASQTPRLSISGAEAWARRGETTAWKLLTENSTARLTGFAILRRADQARSRIAQPQQLRRQAVAVNVARGPIGIEEVFPLAVGAVVAERLVADAAEALGQKIPPLAERGMMEFGHLA